MLDFISKDHYCFDDLIRLTHLLRAPGGCPWDGEQTHLSIRRNFLEEAYEACEGFDRDDPDMMCEELGDVLLQVLFHTDIEHDAGRFSLDDVCDAECKKLVFRHPFLFGGESVSWDEIKKQEKGQISTAQTLEGVARSLPATWRSEKLLKKAADSGLLRESVCDCLDKLQSQVNALRQSAASGNVSSSEVGAMLFSAIGVAASLQIDPEDMLHQACEAFIRQFSSVEQRAAALASSPECLSGEDLHSLWAST